MDPAELARLKRYMRVDHDDDDTVITGLWEAAAQYLRNAGIYDDGTRQYWLAAAGLTLHYYDSAPSVTGTGTNLPLGLRDIINQLKGVSGYV